jgi:hypothetical protein
MNKPELAAAITAKMKRIDADYQPGVRSTH